MYRIMIVEDDKVLREGIVLALNSGETVFSQAATLKEGRNLYRQEAFHLILLDINLPDGNGLDFLKEIKKEGTTPVILLTANDLETDIVSGLLTGADDYVTKPFSLAVLRARVEVQLRKWQGGSGLSDGASISGTAAGESASAIFSCGKYRFNFNHQEFFCGEQRVELSRTEQKLLRILVENKGRSVTREQIISYVWQEEWEFVEENALSVAVNRLRGKLSDKNCIRTIYGVGYCWEVKKP